jgi:hypothetical protein
MDEETAKFGFLMETAQAHQSLATAVLEKLKAHTNGLDAIVREEIRRTLIEELRALGAESKRAAQALHAVGRAANTRAALWSTGITTLCSGVATSLCFGIAWWMLPSRAQIAALRARYDELALAVTSLEQRGGHIDLRQCGDARRLCVRVDRKTPVYGEKADYFIVKGY